MAVDGWGERVMARMRNATIPLALEATSEFRQWRDYGREAKSYLSDILARFSIRDQNYQDSFNFRHGLMDAKVPASHKEIVGRVTSKQSNEILVRLVSLLSAVYPNYIFSPDGLGTQAGLRAAALSAFARSFHLGVEARQRVPIHRTLIDQQLGYGGGILKIVFRLDRWRNLPVQLGDESDKEYAFKVRQFKSRNIPFDITIPEYNSVYYDLTVDGMTRAVESRRITVYDAAASFGGSYNDQTKELHIPVKTHNPEYHEPHEGCCEGADLMAKMPNDPHEEYITHDLVIKAVREVEYTEYWKRGEWCVYMINDVPVRSDYLAPDLPLPYFLALGETTSSPLPGYMGLPLLYNVFEAFQRKLNLRAMEDSFLYKHGFARLIHYTDEATSGAEEPDVGDQEEEEEVIGEILEAKFNKEDWKYLLPANVAALFAHSLQDTDKEIQDAAMADILTGRMPPAGTTGFLMSQLATAAVAKYVPVLSQTTLAFRDAILYVFAKCDKDLESEVVVPAILGETAESAFLTYKPGQSRGNQNLEVRIEAPLPSDQISKTQWMIAGMDRGLVSAERVQREGYRIEQPELENEKMRLETFRKFYEPIAMMRAVQRAGQMDQILEAARMGILPPQLAQLAEMFASGPEGLRPATANPNGVIQPAPGLGQAGVPTTGASSNARAGVVAGGGRAAGAERRPGGPQTPAEPMTPGEIPL